ncbi:MAG: helix-turn-helix transcriptional regulator [Bdellovibrionota bacterium]
MDLGDQKATVELRKATLGLFLKNGREERNMTQSEVAGFLGYSTPQIVSNWERGLATPPLKVIPKLAFLYGIEPKTFIDAFNSYRCQLLSLQKREIEDLFKRMGR